MGVQGGDADFCDDLAAAFVGFDVDADEDW